MSGWPHASRLSWRSIAIAGLALALLEIALPILVFTVGEAPSVGPPRQQTEGVRGVHLLAANAIGVESTGAWTSQPRYRASAMAAVVVAVALATSGGRGQGRIARAAVSKRGVFVAGVEGSLGAATSQPAQLCFSGATRASAAPSAPTRQVGMHLLMPKNIRWKKPHKPAVKPFRHSTKWKFRGFATKGNKPHFGKYALQVTEEAWITSKQIEAIRRSCVRAMERKGKIWVRVFPHQAITQRTAESRMGAGKGNIEYWVAAVRPNFILFEMDGVDEMVAKRAFRRASFELPCKSRFLKKATPSLFELGLAGTAGRGKSGGRPAGDYKKG